MRSPGSCQNVSVGRKRFGCSNKAGFPQPPIRGWTPISLLDYCPHLGDFDAARARDIVDRNPLELEERDTNLNRYTASKLMRLAD